MEHMGYDASRALRGHTFENVHVEGHGAALLGDYHVHNRAVVSAEDRERIARRGTLQILGLDKYRLLT